MNRHLALPRPRRQKRDLIEKKSGRIVRCDSNEEIPRSVLGPVECDRVFSRMERWCALQIPKEKFLVKKFVWGIYPNRFAKNIDMLCINNLKVCKKTFMSIYNFKARNTLKGAGGMADINVSVGSSTLGSIATVTMPEKSVPVVTPAHLQPVKEIIRIMV